MLTGYLFMSICNIFLIMCDQHIYANIRLKIVAFQHNYVDFNNSHINIIMLHVDIIHLACRETEDERS